MKKIKNVLLVLMPILLGSLVGFCVKDDFSYLNTIPHNINLPGFIFSKFSFEFVIHTAFVFTSSNNCFFNFSYYIIIDRLLYVS